MHPNPTSLLLPTKAPVAPNAFQQSSPMCSVAPWRHSRPFRVCRQLCSPPTPSPDTFSCLIFHEPCTKLSTFSAGTRQRPHLPVPGSQQDGPDWLKQKWKVKQILFSSSCPAFPSVFVWFFLCSYPHPIKGELKNHNTNDNVHYDKGDAGRKWDVLFT